MAPVGQPVALVAAGERGGTLLLEASTDAPTSLTQPYCNSDPGVNHCLLARCNNASCGFPTPLDDNHDVSFDITVTESELIGFFGTADCTATDINVGLDIDHTFVSDIQADVWTLGGGWANWDVLSLLQDSPSCSGDNLQLVFDDSAGTAAPACQAGSPAYRGTVRPHDNLNFAELVGTTPDSAGNPPHPSRLWAVLLKDIAPGDSGQVRDVWIAWGLHCETGGGSCSISVDPSSPTTNSLPMFTISGDWPNSCLPSFENGSVDAVNRIIRINGVSNPSCGACPQVVTPFSISAQLTSALPVGDWQVEFHVRECTDPYQLHCSANFQVTQPSCSFSINPASASFSAVGGSGTVAVTAATGCGWNALSNASWITVTAGAPGSGNGAVSYLVAQNATASARTGTISIAGQTFTVTQSAGSGSSCTPGSNDLCLANNRFRVRTTWRDQNNRTGTGWALPYTASSGMFWFFSADNIEFLVKVIDGCGLNSRYWVYAAATTDVEYTMTVTDTLRNVTRTYTNPLGTASPAITDSSAFATCP